MNTHVETVVKTAKTYAKDLAERAANTFWQTFVGVLVITAPTTTWSTAKDVGVSAAAAGVAAVGALLKGSLAKFRGHKYSASMTRSV